MCETGAVTTSLRNKHLTPEQFRTLTFIACFFIGAIIVTGASVRVTGSGLGCPSWPQCSGNDLVPRASESGHAFIEFGNRVFTGLLSISVIVAVLGSFFREPRSKRLIWLSLGLVLGVVAQIVLGGITVLVGLNPLFVAAHMLVSCVILSNAIILCVVSARRETPALRGLWTRHRQLLIAALTFIVVIFGTFVTAAGPHAGDQDVERLNVSVQTVARVHSLSAWVLLLVVAYFIVIKKDRTLSLLVLMGTIVVQGAWGYTQYALGVPSWMVVVHVLLAAILFSASQVYWTTSIQKRH